MTAMIGDLGTRLEDTVIEDPERGGPRRARGIVIACTGPAKAAIRAGIDKATGASRLIPPRTPVIPGRCAPLIREEEEW